MGGVQGIAATPFTERGQDDVEFYLSTNIGEALKPLNRIASGGELSRIILAMKKVLARSGAVSTIVFDEVDSGIGGATAEIVGEKLKEVALHHQVLCITHLPQIACFGDRHYRVVKRVSDGKAKTCMEALSREERLDEITRMLGGVELTRKTRDHAREMLEKAGGKGL
jgi:DNA repair protein RecN (Recombination protein N)